MAQLVEINWNKKQHKMPKIRFVYKDKKFTYLYFKI